jgi:hypothetical protein
MSGRSKLGLAVGLCLCVSGGFASAQEAVPAPPVPAEAPAEGSPHIAFDSLNVNLGDVIHGQDAAATFTFRNTGNAPLHILSAKPG